LSRFENFTVKKDGLKRSNNECESGIVGRVFDNGQKIPFTPNSIAEK